MPTIDDIEPDIFYEQIDHWALLLYQLNGVSLAIPLDNASLMSFLQVFKDIPCCRNHIFEHSRRMVTLFAYSGNIEEWWAQHKNDTPQNLQEIHIFCDEHKDILWMNTYTGRFKSIIKDNFIYTKLNEKLLHYGIGFIDKIKSHFPEDEMFLKHVHKQFCRALSDHFERLGKS